MTVSVVSETMEWADAVPNSNTAPSTPTLALTIGTVASGSQNARIERVQYTLVNIYGESAPSAEVAAYVPAGFVLSIRGPQAHKGDYQNEPLGWNVYVTTGATGTETKQNTSLLPLQTSAYGGVPESEQYYWQEPAAGLIAGASLPTAVAPAPQFVNVLSTLANTPPVPNQDIHVDYTNTNTGRTQMSTQKFLSTFSGIS